MVGRMNGEGSQLQDRLKVPKILYAKHDLTRFVEVDRAPE
jgi:hypothetical protein